MIRGSPRRPMRWTAASGALARCKSVATGGGHKRSAGRVLRSICGVKPTPQAVNKLAPPFIVHGLDKPGVFTTVSANRVYLSCAGVVCVIVVLLWQGIDHKIWS